MKITRFTFCVLLVVSILFSGCTFLLHPINTTFARHSDPLEGWKSLGSAYEVGCPFDKSIATDYRDYIQKLPEEKKRSVDDFVIRFFEDGTGQRAVKIGIDLKGTRWEHVLIYDKNNKRLRVIKYVSGYYMS